MANTLLIIGLFLAVTVTRSGAEVTLPFQSRAARQGRPVTISCEVQGEAFVSWQTPQKAGIQSKSITQQTQGRLTITASGVNYGLRIDDVTVADGGDYTCQGAVQSKVFRLLVDFDSGSVEKYQELKLDEKGIIKLGISAYPKVKYEWRKEDKTIDFTGEKSLDPNTGSISITKVKRSDQGNYTCKVSWRSDAPDGSEDLVSIEVIVTEKPRISRRYGDPIERKLTAGFNVTFHCDVESGSPKPSVTWYFGWDDTTKKVDKNYDARFSHPNEESWTITGIEKDDEGKYACVAENSAGKDTLDLEILQVFVSPTIEQTTDGVFEEGDPVDLDCVVSGDPLPTVKWEKLGSPVSNQQSKEENKQTVATVSFAKINLKDTGEYTCVAQNNALDDNGNVIVVRKTVNLYVKSPPKINEDATVNPVYSFVGYSTPVTVKCVFYGYPVPTVKMTAPNGTEVATGDSAASVTLRTDSVDDFGFFNCSAENEDGQKEEFSVELKIAVPPGSPTDVAVETTCNKIKVLWEPPKDNGGMPIEYYVISTAGDKMSHTESVTAPLEERVIDYTFEPNTDYIIKIKATTAAGPGNDVTLQPVTTKQFCKPGKPSITNTENLIDGTSFTLTWTKPSYDGGDPSLQYKVKWAKTPITDTTKWIENDDLVQGTSLEIKGLEQDTEYEFHVYAKNQEGFGEPAIKRFKVKKEEAPVTGRSSASPTTAVSLHPTLTSSSVGVSELQSTAAHEPSVAAGTDPGLGSGAIAGIVIAVILIVLITIDLFCCFFNSCGVIFCCHKALCAGGGGGGGAGDKSDYMDGKKVPATEMEKKPLPENV